jgi:hypothetical protein
MAKTDDDFHGGFFPLFYLADFTLLSGALRLDKRFHTCRLLRMGSSISADISTSIFPVFWFVTIANPIISHMNVYEPKERLLTTQRKDGKIHSAM